MSHPALPLLEALMGGELYHSVLTITGTTVADISFHRDPAELAAAVAELEAAGKNVYFGVHGLGELPADGRGVAADVAEVSALPVDLDWLDPAAHADKALPTREEVAERLEHFEFRPSILVRSGHGCHGYWLLDEPVTPERGAVLVERLRVALAAAGLAPDPSPLSIVLRPPGTTNRKNGRPVAVKVVKCEPELRWGADLLEERLPEATGPTRIGGGGGHQTWAFDHPDNIRAAELLEATGATLVRQRTRWGLYIKRPGKTADGHSGSIGYHEPGAFHCHSAAWPPFTAGTTYELDQLEHYVEHGWLPTEAERFAALYPALRPASGPEWAPEPDSALAPLWERPALAAIRQAAWSRGVHAGPALLAVLARQAARLPTELSVGGGPRRLTLNLLVAIAARPGVGKGITAELAEELIRGEGVFAELAEGTAPGLLKSFFGPPDKKGDPPVRCLWNAYVRADESRTIADLRDNAGAYLALLCKAFSGERIGSSLSKVENRGFILEAHSYRIAVVTFGQPVNLAWLLADEAAGTPQRHLYGSFDIELPPPPGQRPPWPDVELPTPHIPERGAVMGVDESITAELEHRRYAVQQGMRLEALDEHAGLLRLKVAALLATLEGRLHVGLDDWRLAGAVMAYSDAARTKLRSEIAEAARHEAVGRARARAEGDLVADELKGRHIAEATASAAHSAAKVVAAHQAEGRCPKGCAKRCLARAVASKHRKLVGVDDIIDEALAHDLIVERDGRFHPGLSTG